MAIVEILFIGAVGASIGLLLGVILTLVAFRNRRAWRIEVDYEMS